MGEREQLNGAVDRAVRAPVPESHLDEMMDGDGALPCQTHCQLYTSHISTPPGGFRPHKCPPCPVRPPHAPPPRRRVFLLNPRTPVQGQELNNEPWT